MTFSLRTLLLGATLIVALLGLTQHHNRTLRQTLNRLDEDGVFFEVAEYGGAPFWWEGEWIDESGMDFIWLRSPVTADIKLFPMSNGNYSFGLQELNQDEEVVAGLQRYAEEVTQLVPIKGISVHLYDWIENPVIQKELDALEALGIRVIMVSDAKGYLWGSRRRK